MSSKTDVEVIIGGKVLTLAGYESEEYLQKVASYVNGKINECSRMEGFQRQSLDLQNTLLQLNMADDYLKAKKQIDLLEEELRAREKEVYDLKHELVSVQMKLEAAGRKMEEAERKAEEAGKKAEDAEKRTEEKSEETMNQDSASQSPSPVQFQSYGGNRNGNNRSNHRSNNRR